MNYFLHKRESERIIFETSKKREMILQEASCTSISVETMIILMSVKRRQNKSQ